MKKETFAIGDIPVVLYSRDETKKKPLVILSHGFTSRKEMFETGGQLEELAEMGFCAAAMDNRFHGDRQKPDYRDSIFTGSGKINLLKLREAIKGSADDVSAIIDRIIELSYADENRIAIAGVSMGGFITWRAAAIDKRIKVAIPIIASPFWEDIPGEMPISPGDIKETKDFYAFSSRFQPAENPDQFYPAALLMQIGKEDRHFCVQKIEQFYNSLMPYYKDQPHRLKLIEYENTGHEFKVEMWTCAVDWLLRFL